MKKPRLLKRHYAYVPAPEIPVAEVLKFCPLPAELTYLEPVLRGPLGQALLTSIMACHEEGFSHAQLESVIGEVVSFYTQEYHRCNACFAWTNDFAAGAVVIDGTFKITVVCAKCGRLVASGRVTESMERNMQGHVLGEVAR